MAFRVYCGDCKSRINPPFWSQYGKQFCNPRCAESFKKSSVGISSKNSLTEKQIKTIKVLAVFQGRTFSEESLGFADAALKQEFLCNLNNLARITDKVTDLCSVFHQELLSETWGNNYCGDNTEEYAETLAMVIEQLNLNKTEKEGK